MTCIKCEAFFEFQHLHLLCFLLELGPRNLDSQSVNRENSKDLTIYWISSPFVAEFMTAVNMSGELLWVALPHAFQLGLTTVHCLKFQSIIMING